MIFTALQAPATGTTTHARSPCFRGGFTAGPEKSPNAKGGGPLSTTPPELDAALADAAGGAEAEGPGGALEDVAGAAEALEGGAALVDAGGRALPDALGFAEGALGGADETGGAASPPPQPRAAQVTHAATT